MASSSQTQSQNMAAKLGYKPLPGVLDEVYNSDGQIRDHWAYLLNSLETLGPEALQDRQAKALRILRDDGATYNIYSETPYINAQAPSRTWGLDLVPALISSEEWGKIEAGLLERAELFNLLLRDIYGKRELLRHGVIPPESLFCHPGFLRACQGIALPGEHELIIHAVDLMRSGDGDICVLTDRTQSPSGAGYALENRTVMSRVLPSLFRDSHVHRLATFFQRLRSKLVSLAPNREQPRIVVLTPGAHNETFFEHAYLAKYMGLHLVQSGDLVVRNGYVWMKSLDGLHRVDVILRRVDDWFCDPVELRSDSQLGVPNLLEVVRAGHVAMANPLGSGILENPIFLKYLPDISKTLLGRELRLNSTPTWWCGDKQDLAYVLDNLDTLVVKPVNRSNTSRSILGANLTVAQKQELALRIKANPIQFIAQPVMTAGHMPTFDGNKLVPRPALLRSFAVASGTSYTVMPGGLTRVGKQEASFMISSQAGSLSKDTWVIASEPERVVARPQSEDSSIQMREADLVSMPSRVLENLFWMGRYAERAEASLRILRTVFMLLNSEESISAACKRTLLEAVTEVTSTHPGFINATEELVAAPEEELLQIVKDSSRSGSVCANLNYMLNCADESKELLSSDMLRVLNDIRDALPVLDQALAGGLASAPEKALDPLVTALLALTGLTQESMVRSTGWRFMEIGRRLERGLQTIAIIRNLAVQKNAEPDENTLLQALLQSLEVLISYRRRYGTRMTIASSLDLVMMDASNPRSLAFQLEQLGLHIRSLPKATQQHHELAPEERAALEAETLLKLRQLSELSMPEDGKRQQLDSSLLRLKHLMASISTFVSAKYFDHKQPSQQLVSSVGENMP